LVLGVNTVITRTCKIYPNRPKGCRDFICDWLKGQGTDADRPDKVGYVLDYTELPEQDPILQMYEYRVGCLKGEYVEVLKRHWVSKGVPVILIYRNGKRKLFIHMMMALPSDVLEYINTESIEVIRYP
jgi:hypothetical protein